MCFLMCWIHPVSYTHLDVYKRQAILMDEMPIIPLYYLNAIVLAKPDVTGLVKNADGHTLFRNADKL